MYFSEKLCTIADKLLHKAVLSCNRLVMRHQIFSFFGFQFHTNILSETVMYYEWLEILKCGRLLKFI